MSFARAIGSLGVFAALLSGCGAADYEAKSAAPAADIASAQTLGRPILLLGDNQVQHLFGKGVFERTGLSDYVARTAVRPVQLDMFAHQLLIDACRAVPDVPIIHLGDAANSACVQELDRTFALMRACGDDRPWVMAPGNHDAFLMGSVHRTCRLKAWEDACYDVGTYGPRGHDLSKNVLVRRLLDRTWKPQTGEDYALRCDEPKAAQRLDDCTRGTISRKEAPVPHRNAWSAFLVQATFLVDEEAPWRSFLLQWVDISDRPSQPVFALVLDTVHYDERPRVWPRSQDPGTTGAIDRVQRDAIEDALNEHEKAFFLLVGHHPLEKLQEGTRDFVLELAQRKNLVAYVSGHTHLGGWYEHTAKGRKGPFVELNVGSVTDHPNEFRDLRLLGVGSGDAPDLVWLVSQLNPGRSRPLCEPGSLPDPRDYLAYRNTPQSDATGLQRQLLRSQAMTWVHFLLNSGFDTGGRDFVGPLESALALPAGGGADEALRRACYRVAHAVFPELDGTSPSPAQPVQVEAYMRCVAYDAARYEGRLSSREVARSISCAKRLNLRAVAEPFTQATEWMQVVERRDDEESSEKRHE
jgi:3',5'-cyclic AMP phosphodiesterase CpdA